MTYRLSSGGWRCISVVSGESTVGPPSTPSSRSPPTRPRPSEQAGATGLGSERQPIGDCEMPRIPREGQGKNAGHPTRRVRYGVAMSLDGFIAGPNGEADWIIMDPEIDFKATYSRFDTMLMGRRTFERMQAAGDGSMPGMQVFVCSRTLRQEDHPGVTVVDDP